ncbi:multidrug effflux MFS transporter [Roseomonas sp. OT10]|uniref:multidrug effflux MFS transporter n=1 Tax=Roseomonas cutis TaxID=2897332 RepID=UPI001E52130D|nr:multidrug effflux MFS transporter [Roseomonas sp. OT10]UFN50202.1 multidrug effflux MFS transporter [Roseomonas sp. OT10]
MTPRDLGYEAPTGDETPPDAARRAPPLWLLVAMTGLGPFAMQLVIPTLPVLAQVFGAPYGQAQLTLTLYLMGVALGQLLYGPLSDRYGRRPLLFAGLGLYLVASLLAALAPSIGWLILARVLQGTGACAGMVLGRAIVRDVWPREQAASRMGYVMMGMTVAPMLGPIVGAVVEEFVGWRGTMLMAALVGIPVLLVARARLRETLVRPQALPGLAGLLGAYLQLLTLQGFRACVAIVACTSGVFFGFLAGAPHVVVQGLGHSPRTFAMIFVVIAVCFAAGSWIAGRYSIRLGMRDTLRLGLLVTTAGSVLCLALQLTLPPALAAFFLPMALIALGNGISQPAAVTAAISVRPQLAGTASGLVGAIQMTFGALMTVLAGWVEAGHGIGTAFVMLGCALGAQLALRGAQRALSGSGGR